MAQPGAASYQRRTLTADALIAGAYLAGTNTRRVRRALAALFRDGVSKDIVSRVWRKIKSDWDAWNARSLTDEPMVRLIGGHVAKKLGDGLMALFGYPVAQENDAERAARAALSIQRSLADINRKNASSGKPELNARIGIETGPVVVDAAGEIYGDAPNTANDAVWRLTTFRFGSGWPAGHPQVRKIQGNHGSAGPTLLGFADCTTASNGGDLVLKSYEASRGIVTPTDVVSEKARVCQYQSHSWGFVLGLSESEGREARWASALLSDLLRSCSFLGPCRQLSAQPPQGFKIIVEGLYNFDRSHRAISLRLPTYRHRDVALRRRMAPPHSR